MKILLVDDSKVILAGIKGYLDDEKFDIHTASDGMEALNLFQKNNGEFDLIITDVNMPNMSGLELAQKIRGGSINNQLPIVVLTSEESDKIKEEGKKIGVSAWVTKPPKKENLLKVVNHFEGK